MHLESLLEPRRRRIRKYLDLEEQARKSQGAYRDRLLSYIAIEALNLWTQFCRGYAIDCCRGTRSLNGSQWFSPVAKGWPRPNIVAHLTLNFSRKRARANPKNPLDEPDWRDIVMLTRCCAQMGVPNVPALQYAASLSPSFLRELHAVRNFAAHRCENSRLKMEKVAKARGNFSLCALEDVMLMPSSSRSSGTVARQWLVEIDNLMIAMSS